MISTGTLLANDAYTPGSGFWSVDTFTYAASDGIPQSAPATVSDLTLP